MPWSGDQLPWTFKYPNPSRPSGQWESLNYMKGAPTLIRGRASSLANLKNTYRAPVLIKGAGSRLANLKSIYRASSSITGGMGSALSNLNYFPGTPVLQGTAIPIIAGKLERFLAR
jgi:hypothetical protein